MPAFTILHVEDEPSDQIIVSSAFRRVAPGVDLRTVSDGEQAVEYLSGQGPYADRQAHPLPHLILLDLKLPRRSGFEVLEFVRSYSDTREVPVIVLTSSPEVIDIERAYAVGATSYLVKCVDIIEMREIVRGIADYLGLLP